MFDLKKKLLEANDSFKEGKFVNSKFIYEEILKLYPDNEQYWINYIGIHLNLKQLKEAETISKTAIKQNSNFSKVNYNLGTILQLRGKLDESILHYRKAIDIDPNYIAAHNNLGIILKKINKLEEAELSFSKTISLKPDYAFAHYHMANTKYKLRKFDESELSYRKAISIKPNYVEAYVNLSKTLRELGRFKEAELNARTALEIKPEFVESNVQLSVVLFDIGRLGEDLKGKNLSILNEAKELSLKAINLKPDYSLSHFSLGNIFQELGKLSEAKNCFEKSLNLDSTFSLAKHNLDILLNQMELLDKIKNNQNDKKTTNLLLKNKLDKKTFILKRNVEKELIECLYKINSTELNKTKGGPLFGIGKTSNYQLFNNKHNLLKNVKKDLENLIEQETKFNVHIMDSFFNILGTGGGSVPHHHLNSFDKTFNLYNQKYSLTYYLSVGDQNCKEPGIFKLYEPDEEILPSNGMIMIIPSSRKHSAVYDGKIDRVMIGVNFYIF